MLKWADEQSDPGGMEKVQANDLVALSCASARHALAARYLSLLRDRLRDHAPADAGQPGRSQIRILDEALPRLAIAGESVHP